MKKIYYLLWMLPLLFALGGCEDQDDIIFDHERPMFEIKSDAILLEVIVPQGTKATDDIYIVGAFNGGEEQAVGQMQWRLEKASASDMKFGIYLNPSTFQNGKTLADGFYFVSDLQGVERTVKNEDAIHTLDVKIGSRTNVMVSRWKAYFEKPEEIVHDGFAVFVEDNTGWPELGLYYYGVEGPGWPGMPVTGTEVIDGVAYKYFDMGEALSNSTVTIIFNNNGGTPNAQVEDAAGLTIKLDRNYYYRLTATGYEEVSTYKGYRVYIDDQTGWDALGLYGYANDAPVTPAWPGLPVTGTKVINGVTYTYFDMGEDLNNIELFLILNNNGGDQQANGPEVKLNRDHYFRVTASSWTEVDPNETVEPETFTYSVYVENNTGWTALGLYYWADGLTTPGWPGIQPADTKDVDGVTYTCFNITTKSEGQKVNLIFNNNGGDPNAQLDGPAVTLNRDYYFRITDATYQKVRSFAVYIEDNTGWEALGLYCWAEGLTTPGWPGMPTTGTEVVGDKTYKYFLIPDNLAGESVNLIFNSTVGGDGGQFDGPFITLDKDLFFSITSDFKWTQITF